MCNFEKLINNGCMDVVFLILVRKNWGVTLKKLNGGGISNFENKWRI